MGRILVTGGTGFIGRVLCRRLGSQHEVLALVRPASTKVGVLETTLGVQLVRGELGNPAEWLGRLGPLDAVIHLAWGGMSKQEQHDPVVQERNYWQSMELVDATHVVGCPLFISGGSQAEYASSDQVITETSACAPATEYGRAKLRFTQDGVARCRHLGMRHRMGRIFSVYGPQDHPWTLLPGLLTALARREMLPLTDCRQQWNYLYVEDAAAALVSLLLPGCEDGIYNLASRRSAPLSEFVSEACALFPDSPRPRLGALSHGPQGPRSLRPSVTKLVQNTGWAETVSFPEGLRRTWDSMRPQPTSSHE